MQLEKILKLAIPITIVGAVVYEGIRFYQDLKYLTNGSYITKVREKGL